MKTVVIADDHPLLLEGTKQYLKKNWFNVVGTMLNGNDTYNAIIKLEPDLAIIDFNMPDLDGLEIAKTLKSKGSTTKIIILTLHKEEAIVNEVGSSISGYITKDTALQELIKCIHTVLNGNTYISPNLKGSVLFDTNSTNIEKLTATELKILKYLSQNLNSSEISDNLFISKRTVEKHRSNIIKKLELSDKQNALILWIKSHPELFKT
jgi:DNA-binding NarL/FixJ family response regulator